MYRDDEGIYHLQILQRFSNPHHAPSGSPHGGEFVKGGGSGSSHGSGKESGSSHGGHVSSHGSSHDSSHGAASSKPEHPVETLVRQMNSDPQIVAAIKANKDRGDHRGDPGVTHNREYTREALAENKKIAQSFLTPESVAPPGKKPVAVIMLGRPGSGKSTIAAQLKGFPPTAQINSDLVMEHLPGYKPQLSSSYHGRATNIAQHDLMPAALAGRHNVTFDTTGRDPGFAKDLGNMFVKHGYDVHVVHVQTRAEVAVQRGFDRFKEGGRFIPVQFLADPGMGPGTRASYNALKKVAKSWKQYENSGDHNPKEIDSGSR
jgi:predicted ABC-type ATPase